MNHIRRSNSILIQAVLSFAVSVLFIGRISFSSPAVLSGSLFTEKEKKIAVNGGFLTSAYLSGRGSISSGGIESGVPARNSYITVSPSGYDMTVVEKGFFYLEGSRINRMKIYRAMTDIKSLKGMQYYSRTDGKTKVLIVDSSEIGNSAEKTGKKNTGFQIPEKIEAGISIKDNRLGLLNFKSVLYSRGDDFIMVNTSLGEVSAYGMKVFLPGDYRIYKFLIYDKKRKGYFFYTAQFMKLRSGILNSIDLVKPESFGNRVRAENIHFLKSIGIDRSADIDAFK